MGAADAKQILVDAINGAPRMQGEHPASWLTCRIRLALDALDTPEAWNFGEPPEERTICWATDGEDVYRVVFVGGKWVRSVGILNGVIAWKPYTIPPPPTVAEIEAGRRTNGIS